MVVGAEVQDSARIPEHESFPPVADDIIQESTSFRGRKKKKGGKVFQQPCTGSVITIFGQTRSLTSPAQTAADSSTRSLFSSPFSKEEECGSDKCFTHISNSF